MMSHNPNSYLDYILYIYVARSGKKGLMGIFVNSEIFTYSNSTLH